MIKLSNVNKIFSSSSTATEPVLSEISFHLNAGEVVCILGPSGSGKSTLLRVMAGLETVDSGDTDLPENGQAAYVAQEYTLWPHLDVLENLKLAPKLQGRKPEDVEAEALSLLRRFGMEDCSAKYPSELSGGQRQRVALLRAVITKPKVLLLDEITSALDPELTKSVLDLIRALSKDGYAMCIVTHHLSFAMSVADRIVFLKQGRLVQDTRAVEFFSNQTDPEIRAFLLDIAKRDELIEVHKGTEQFQAYHLGLMKRLPERSVVYIAGGLSDTWYEPMGDRYKDYEELRIQKNIKWKMLTYVQGDIEHRLQSEHPELNEFRSIPRGIDNPANYNVFGDTVITQVFEGEPTIIEIKNQHTANAYLKFFEELWEKSTV